ncbi:DUF2735 domain-containing protein [Rhizobium sp. SSA_523]|uniref:DUF2735 domain-containing protein n=1 Tax=Rhizobium sp. SSA_523 TaxID=2952477 RepID=UPI002090EBFE|nr:DUF2735 domain-containing protein [Rhizobium sp. SSA_523]MCO5731868.1 DUF2735 domain-containing protein [Rhizobium sp. SSA_523]WKC22773.1 DUF2735 domain-containing protein [Rhizobium sp. SSA_523]
MNASHERPTATIIPFPAGGLRQRRAVADQRGSTVDVQPARYSDLAFGGAWYHDEAIREKNDSPAKLS